MTTDLSMATTDELWQEIRSRYTAVVLLSLRPDKTDPDADHLSCWWKGNLVERIGLVQYGSEKFHKQVFDMENDAESSDGVD